MSESQKRLRAWLADRLREWHRVPHRVRARPRNLIPIGSYSYLFTSNAPTVHRQCIVLLGGFRDSVRHDDAEESKSGWPDGDSRATPRRRQATTSGRRASTHGGLRQNRDSLFEMRGKRHKDQF